MKRLLVVGNGGIAMELVLVNRRISFICVSCTLHVGWGGGVVLWLRDSRL